MSSLLANLRAVLPGAMPRNCFISHSFKDTEGLARLKVSLPWYVEPHIFPQIDETPDMTVSTQLIDAVLACRGLVYIASRNSIERPYVSFERDYGARSGRDVFEFDPATASFRRERLSPFDLQVFPSFTNADRDKVQAIIAFMEKRHFSISPERQWQSDQYRQPFDNRIGQTIAKGGRIVVFVSNASLGDPKVAWELEEAARRNPDRILPVMIEPIQHESWRRSERLAQLTTVNLHGAGPHDLHWPMVDRLIVAIYHFARTAPEGTVL